MARDYSYGQHMLVKLFEEENITFPISMKELLDRIGDKDILINAKEKITVKEYMNIVELDEFENRDQFMCTLSGRKTELGI